MIYLFDEEKKLTGTVKDAQVRALRFARERNGLYESIAEIPVISYDKSTENNLHTKTKDAVFFGHYDLEDRFQLFKVAAYDVDSGMIRIHGVHLFFDEAKAGAIIRERRYINREISDGARDAFAEIGWQMADFDVSPARTYNFYNVSPLEARAKLIETFNYEFDYWLDFDGKKISGKYFSVKKRIGSDNGRRYVYNKHVNNGNNVLTLRAEQDFSEVYTAVIGRGRGEEYEDTGGYGRRIEFTDIEWKRPNDPLDKPLGRRILHDLEATQAFGYVEGNTVKPRIAVVEFTDIEEQDELIEATYDWLVEHRQPKLLFDVSVADGDGLDLGDTVYVKYNDIKLNLAVRVGKVTEDIKTGERHVELGDVSYFKPGRSNRDIKRSIAQARRDASDRIFQLKLAFDENFDKAVQQMRDDYEQALIDAYSAVEAAEVRMTELINSERDALSEKIDEDIAQARSDAEDEYARIESEVSGAIDSTRSEMESEFDTKVADAREYADTQIADKEAQYIEDWDARDADIQQTIETVVGGSVDALDTSLLDVNRRMLDKLEASDLAPINNRIDGVSGDLSSAREALQAQLDDADSSIDTANDKIEAVEGRITDAEGKLATNDQNIADAQQRLTQAEQDISEQGTDIGTVQQTLTNIDGELASKVERTEYDALEGTVTSHGTRISQNETDINSKAEQSEVDTISGTVSDHSTEISQNATDIKSKADSTTVDSIDETVTSHSTLISQNSTDIQSKADASVVDSLSGTVENHSTEISQNAQHIESKAEQSVVDTLSGTVSDHESRITQNAKGIESKVSSEELNDAIDAIEVGGRNLLLNTGFTDGVTGWSGCRLDEIDGVPVAKATGTMSENGRLPLEQNQYYTASMEIYPTVDIPIGNTTPLHTYYRSDVSNNGGMGTKTTPQRGYVAKANEWTKITETVKTNQDVTTFKFHVYYPAYINSTTPAYIKNIKFEKGNKVTDWTPAPEDTEAKITDINTILTTHDTTITQNAEAITSKADKSVVDTLSGTVGEHSTTITQTAEEMKRKAESSVVDAISGTVESHTLTITETAKDVSSLIEKTELHDGDIAQWSNETQSNAEEIGRTLTRISDIDGEIERAQTEISTNADGISGLLTRTSEAEQSIADISLSVDGITADFASYKQDIDGEIGQLSAQVASYEASVDGFRAEVGTLQGDMNSVDDWIIQNGSSIEQTVEGFRQRVWTRDIDPLTQRLDGHEAYISDLQFTADRFDVTIGEVESSLLDQIRSVDTWHYNMLQGTRFDEGFWNPTFGTIRTDEEIPYYYFDPAVTTSNLPYVQSTQEIVFEPGEVYRLSFDWQTYAVRAVDYVYIIASPDDGGSNVNIGTPIVQGSRIDGTNLFTSFGSEYGRYFIEFSPTRNIRGYLRIGANLTNNEHGRRGFKLRLPYLTTTENTRWLYHQLDSSQNIEEVTRRISKLEQTADSIDLLVAEINDTAVRQSEIYVGASGVQIGSTFLGDSQFASIFRVSPRTIDAVAEQMRVSGDLYVKGEIQSFAMEAVEGEFARLWADSLGSTLITADHIDTSTMDFSMISGTDALIERLVARTAFINAIQGRELYFSNGTIGRLEAAIIRADVIKGEHIESNTIEIQHLRGYDAILETLMARTVFSNEVNAISLNAVYADLRKVDSEIMDTNILKADWIEGGNALIDKVFANTAMFERMMAKSGFVRTLNTVTIDTDQLTIRRPDGVAWVSNGVPQFDHEVHLVQYMDSEVDWTGQRYRTNSATPQIFSAAYTSHASRYLRFNFSVSMDSSQPSASTIMGVRISPGNVPSGRNWQPVWEDFAVHRGSGDSYTLIMDLGRPTYQACSFTFEVWWESNSPTQRNLVQVRPMRCWMTG